MRNHPSFGWQARGPQFSSATVALVVDAFIIAEYAVQTLSAGPQHDKLCLVSSPHWQEEAIEDPLAAHVQDSIERTFTTYYHWTLTAARRAADSIRGRFRREFEQCTPPPAVSAAVKINLLHRRPKR